MTPKPPREPAVGVKSTEFAYRKAYELSYNFGRIAVAINGSRQSEGMSGTIGGEQSDTWSKIGDISVGITTILREKIPHERLNDIEQDFFQATGASGNLFVDTDADSQLEYQAWPGLSESPSLPLSETETKIFNLAIGGTPVVEIAENLSISPSTVGSHLGNVYIKLGARTLDRALVRAHELRGDVIAPNSLLEDESLLLTPIQRQILGMRWSGSSTEEICEQLGIGMRRHKREKDTLMSAFGVDTWRELAIAVVGAGGPDKFPEPVPFDRENPFLPPDTPMPEINKTVISCWISEIFVRYPDTFFTKSDLAKVLFGEVYAIHDQALNNRAKQTMLLATGYYPGKKVAIIEQRLSEADLVLSRLSLGSRGRHDGVFYISHSPDKKYSPSDIEGGPRLSDEELRAFAIKLRQEEILRQQAAARE